MTDTPESDRGTIVIKLALAHFEYGRKLLHDLVNSYPSVPITAMAAEQAIEMDVRHALVDAATFANYLPKDGGAV